MSPEDFEVPDKVFPMANSRMVNYFLPTGNTGRFRAKKSVLKAKKSDNPDFDAIWATRGKRAKDASPDFDAVWVTRG